MFLQADTALDQLTFALVLVTGILAAGTLLAAFAALWGVIVNRRQIEVTREQLRPRLELEDPRWPPPGQIPTANVVYASGFEAAQNVYAWLKTSDGRRFGTACNAPSHAHMARGVNYRELSDDMVTQWDARIARIDREVDLAGDEWWAAVTWQAADGASYVWVHVQRTQHVDTLEQRLSPSPRPWRDLLSAP